jgi:hypothetical protein
MEVETVWLALLSTLTFLLARLLATAAHLRNNNYREQWGHLYQIYPSH